MRLVRKVNARYVEVICTGSIVSLEENKPLASMLATIQENGIDCFFADEKLKKFAVGLLHSFENDGLINSRVLTPLGKDVIKNKKAWKELKGIFKLCVVVSDKYSYIVDFVPQYGDEISGYQLQKNASLKFMGDYENNRGMHIKDVKLNPNCYIGNNRVVEIECVYDYKTDRNAYVVDIDGKRVEFPENPNTFKLVDSYDAKDLLRAALVNYGNFSVNDTQVTIIGHENNKLFDNAINDTFDKGSFNAIAGDMSYDITDIRTIIKDEEIAKGLLMKFLINKAKEKYCGYSEVASLIATFYGLFERCPDILVNTQTIYANLIEKAAASNKTAYLRLRAYEDLMPDTIQGNYEVMRPKDFSNSKMSIAELVKQIVGRDTAKSVTLLTKYAYKNAAISRAINLFANALRRQYNIPLRLITAKNTERIQAEAAKEFYEELKTNPNIIFSEKAIKDIEKIHDRYYRVERESGDVVWIKMTGELDAFRYNNDFVDGKTPNGDIDENTTASVKEMTIIGVGEDGIIPAVIKAMEN
ncbi:MAG: hypothetical protein K2N30_05505 [Clostridia bacterium]|nr:hypothetical protein [Clostridia bacterium]